MLWLHALKLELRPCVQTDISIFHDIIPPIYRYRKNVIPTELTNINVVHKPKPNPNPNSNSFPIVNQSLNDNLHSNHRVRALTRRQR